MKHMNLKKLAAIVLLISMLFSLANVAAEQPQYPADVPNGDFETEGVAGRWVGWTRKDAAFNVRGIVSDEKINGAPMEKSGERYFSGLRGGNPVMRGTLTSDPFILGGTGYITFKMGGGKDIDKAYVEFFELGNDTPLARVVNEDCDGVFITEHLISKVVDLSAHIGKVLYVKVTDNDDGSDMAHLNLDAFRTAQSMAEVEAALAERERQVADYGPRPFAEDPAQTTVVNGGFETGDLSGWLLLEGKALTVANIVPTSQYYWNDRMVYGEGQYYLDGSNNGATPEGDTGAIRSTKFTLAGDGFISFMIGAGNKNCYVAICDGETDEELIKVENTYFSDPSLALTLLRYYVDAGQYLGRVLYLKVVDANDTSAFAFMNVDDFRVSLTKAEVADLAVEWIEKINQETYSSASFDDLTSLRNYYANYPYPVPLNTLNQTAFVQHQTAQAGTLDLTTLMRDAKATYGELELNRFVIQKVHYNGQEYTEGFDAFALEEPGFAHVTYGIAHEGKEIESTFTIVVMTDQHSIANGGFEAGNLAGWTVTEGNWGIVEGHPSGVISAKTYWGENLPYNQSGEYHLNGWNNGIPEPETWRVRSTPFVLGGSGFISAKMGAHAAAVRVYLADGTMVGHYRQNRFNDANFPSLAAGGSWADMGSYVMDLSDYLGQEMYLELCDEQVEGWSHAFFDEVVTYYETAPDYANLKDEVADGGSAAQVFIPWQLAPNQK